MVASSVFQYPELALLTLLPAELLQYIDDSFIFGIPFESFIKFFTRLTNVFGSPTLHAVVFFTYWTLKINLAVYFNKHEEAIRSRTPHHIPGIFTSFLYRQPVSFAHLSGC